MLPLAIAEARHALQTLYGDRLQRVVLYGSRARGDAHEDSDVDVLVVLDGSYELYHETGRLADVAMRLLDRYGLLFHFKLMEDARYRDEEHPLMMHVRREGVEV